MNWIINSCRKSGRDNEQAMLDNNIFYIGFGTPIGNRKDKKSNTTIKQFDFFSTTAKKGDKIHLYVNKIGIVAIGEFTGTYYLPKTDDEKAPDWSKLEGQCHVKIDKWNKLSVPLKYKPRPLTLYLDKNMT